MPFTPASMVPPASFKLGTVQGSATVYTPTNGVYTITDPDDVQSLLVLGWSIAVVKQGGGIWKCALTGVNPSATLNVFGAAQNVTPNAGATEIVPLSFDIVFGGTFGSETVTVQFVMNYSDGTTATVTFTATGTGTTSLTNAQLRSLVADGLSISFIAISSKSTINSSTATVAINGHGENSTR